MLYVVEHFLKSVNSAAVSKADFLKGNYSRIRKYHNHNPNNFRLFSSSGKTNVGNAVMFVRKSS